jgi:hypothetical protein
MKPEVTIAPEARAHMLALLEAAQGSEPFVVLEWRLPTGELNRCPNGETEVIRVPEQGSVHIVSGVPMRSESIETIDGIPVYIQVPDPRLVLHVTSDGKQFMVHKRNA